jgi:drug/metabolite transporter (DMT)-like permease
MSLFATLLLAIFLIGTAAGQLLFKAASVRASRKGEAHWSALALDPLLWVGIVIYVLEFFVWLAFMSLVPLWQAVMVANVDILLVMVCGRIFFAERITPPRVVSILLISVGVILVGWGP